MRLGFASGLAIDVILPDEGQIGCIDAVIFNEMCRGVVEHSLRKSYLEIMDSLAARVAAHDQTASSGETVLIVFEDAVCADADLAAYFGSSQLVTAEVCALLLISSSSQGDDGYDSVPTAQRSAGNALVSAALRSAADASDNVASLAALVAHRRCSRAPGPIV